MESKHLEEEESQPASWKPTVGAILRRDYSKVSYSQINKMRIKAREIIVIDTSVD